MSPPFRSTGGTATERRSCATRSPRPTASTVQSVAFCNPRRPASGSTSAWAIAPWRKSRCTPVRRACDGSQGWILYSREPCRPEPRPLCGDFHVVYGCVWFRDWLANFTHRLEVLAQGVLKVPACLCLCVTYSRTSGNIRRISGVTRLCSFDDYRITPRAHFSPAFLSIAFNVPGASSLPSLPGTVITKAWLGCLKCRWLPLDRISTHPCFSSRRITSRTFIGIRLMVRYRAPSERPEVLGHKHKPPSPINPSIAAMSL